MFVIVVNGGPAPAEAKLVDATGGEPSTSYSPSPAYPYGWTNSEAPAELGQFAFMIGEFDCVDTIRRAKWRRLSSLVGPFGRAPSIVDRSHAQASTVG